MRPTSTRCDPLRDVWHAADEARHRPRGHVACPMLRVRVACWIVRVAWCAADRPVRPASNVRIPSKRSSRHFRRAAPIVEMVVINMSVVRCMLRSPACCLPFQLHSVRCSIAWTNTSDASWVAQRRKWCKIRSPSHLRSALLCTALLCSALLCSAALRCAALLGTLTQPNRSTTSLLHCLSGGCWFLRALHLHDRRGRAPLAGRYHMPHAA